jgi:hypothetical protein
MTKLFCVQLRDHLVLRHNRLSSCSGFVLTILLYTHDLIPKIPVHIFHLENIVKSCFRGPSKAEGPQHLVSWSSKKQTSIALSTVEAEYVAVGQCCAQLLWMRQTLRDFG